MSLSAIYFIGLVIYFFIYKHEYYVGLKSLGLVLPVIVLYFLGRGIFWAYQGFKANGFKKPQGWQRIWVLLSVIYLLLTSGIVVENIRDEISKKHVLSLPLPREGIYRIVGGENSRIYFESNEMGAVKIGEIKYISSLIPTLNKVGTYYDSAKIWDVPEEFALSVLEKPYKHWFVLAIFKILFLWFCVPVVVYFGVNILVIGIVWVSAGFREKAVA